MDWYQTNRQVGKCYYEQLTFTLVKMINQMVTYISWSKNEFLPFSPFPFSPFSLFTFSLFSLFLFPFFPFPFSPFPFSCFPFSHSSFPSLSHWVLYYVSFQYTYHKKYIGTFVMLVIINAPFFLWKITLYLPGFIRASA